MDLKTLQSIKKETLNNVGNKFDQDTRSHEKEVRVVLKNVDIINPESIDEYIARDGYFGLEKALTTLKPEEVLQMVDDAGLRGRSGGGFPTGLKWRFTAKAEGDQKYVVCNADEGEPAAFMDGALLEKDPHSVIEGMILAGYAIGATEGYNYIRWEYPEAYRIFTQAVEQAREKGLLGKNLFGSGFDFDIFTFMGAGAYECGEETALLSSIEGDRGNAKNKPPFPANKGLWQKPTIINNVETLVNVPLIVFNGVDWFRGFGTEKSSGTKCFGLTGKVKEPKLIEVPMGITLRELVYDIGGGFPEGRKFKAIATSQPNFGVLAEEHLDTTVEYDTIAKFGAMMGSGGMIVLDDTDCIVDFTRFNMEFLADESCGRCTPCREGTLRMTEILEKICHGEGTMKDLDLLQKLATMAGDNALCGLGQATVPPVFTTINNFREEYLAHINDKKCPAGKCKIG